MQSYPQTAVHEKLNTFQILTAFRFKANNNINNNLFSLSKFKQQKSNFF